MKVFFTTLSLVLSVFVIAQQPASQSEQFVAHGKPIIKVFSDFSTNIKNGDTQSGFQISRAHFGYNYQFSQNFSGQVMFDVSSSAGINPSSMTAFLKNAYTMYASESFAASFGLIGTQAFSLSEKVWGKRYLYKSMQDEYGFNYSADLGSTVSYQFLPQLSADISIFNGEGFKKIQMDNVFQYAAGITVEPVKDLYIRVYGDWMKGIATQNTLSAFVGYQGAKASIGADYAYQSGNRMVVNHDFNGLSFFGTFALANKLSMFGRYDHMQSTQIGASSLAWNGADGKVYIAGLEYSPVKGIKIAPNFRYADYVVGSATTHIFLNFEMSL